MKIDSHHHLWTYSAQEFGWVAPEWTVLRRDFSAPEYETHLREAGYEGSIAVQARPALAETEFLLEQARSWPWIRGVVGWADLASPELGRLLASWTGTPLVGLRHAVQAEPPGFLQRPEVEHGLALLETLGLTFDLLVFPRQLSEAAEAARRFPRLNFVLDHLGKPLEDGPRPLGEWERGLALLARCPNVSVKLSGWFTESLPSRWSPQTTERLFQAALDHFGPQRLLASSNWPVSELAGGYAWTMGWVERFASQLPAASAPGLLGENAARVYGLDRHSARNSEGVRA